MTRVLNESKCSEVLPGQTSHINLWRERNATCCVQICRGNTNTCQWICSQLTIALQLTAYSLSD